MAIEQAIGDIATVLAKGFAEQLKRNDPKEAEKWNEAAGVLRFP